jgi:hypothetical protein
MHNFLTNQDSGRKSYIQVEELEVKAKEPGKHRREEAIKNSFEIASDFRPICTGNNPTFL